MGFLSLNCHSKQCYNAAFETACIDRGLNSISKFSIIDEKLSTLRIKKIELLL